MTKLHQYLKKNCGKVLKTASPTTAKRKNPTKEKFVGYAKSVIIVGQSIIKQLIGWEMSKDK